MYIATQLAHVVRATSEQLAADSAAKVDATIMGIALIRTRARASVVSRVACAKLIVGATATDSVVMTVRASVM